MQFSRSHSATLRVAGILAITFFMLWLVCYRFVNDIPVLFVALALFNVAHALLLDSSSLLRLWKRWYKKMLFLLAINVLFAFIDIRFHIYDGFLRLLGQQVNVYGAFTPMEYYQHAIARTFLTLMNTILILEIAVQKITFADLLRLPIHPDLKKHLLFFRSILNFLIEKIDMNDIVFDTIPEYQFYPKSGFISDFKHHYKKNLILIFTLIKIVNEQSIIIGELIENKLTHTNTIRK
ncbi:hypothetical protein ACWKWU_11125 [Chitinophaga lutea]